MCYKTHRSLGIQKCYRTYITSGRIGNAVPLPVLAPGYFHRIHRSFGYGLKCVTEITGAPVGLQKCYITHRSSDRVGYAIPLPGPAPGYFYRELTEAPGFFKKNLNACQSTELPPVRGQNDKTFRWDHRLQRHKPYRGI